ncbi:type IV pilin protein [Candidatus Avelusimicrobium luingense]|uniref:type IV pilin protein n=1 Tax=Candidatus Avelusimicrobium luingense TaxID=3416211 RepID=UPI003D0AE8E1
MKSKQAFTLIELLVVVLIIGILAAVALPQYTKVVERSKSAQALTLLNAVAQAQLAYLLANGEYATKFDDLAIDIPWTGNTQFLPGSNAADTKSNADWTLQIEDARSGGYGVGIYMIRTNGKYKGAGFRLLLADASSNYNEDLPIYCMERTTGALFLFDSSLPAGAYCAQIIKGSLKNETQFNRLYNLP